MWAVEPASSPMSSPRLARPPGLSDSREERRMSADVKFMSPYEKRLKLVADTISEHEKLGGKAASELAVHVLQALDHIPEKVR